MVSLKTSGATAFRIMGTEGEAVLHSIIEKLTGQRLYSPNEEASPWLLKSCGTCDAHINFSKDMVFTLLICLHIDYPYNMKISVNTCYNPKNYKDVTMDTGSWTMFLSAMSHKCIAK